MLGRTLDDSAATESGRSQTLRGLGLLPTSTVFSAEKRRTQVCATAAAGPFAGAALTGYEIHTGRTVAEGEPFDTLADGTPEGCVCGNVFGTYLHGLFDTGELTKKLTEFLCRRKGIRPEVLPLLVLHGRVPRSSSTTSWPMACGPHWTWPRSEKAMGMEP